MKRPECACTCGEPGCHSLRPRTHGTPSCYRDGCRCDECRATVQQRVDRHHKAANARTQEKAVKSRQLWTSAEMEIATRPDLTAEQAALMLGRTYRAVIGMRHRCKRDPKTIAMLGATTPTPPAASPEATS